MKPRYTTTNFSSTWQRRENYRRNDGSGLLHKQDLQETAQSMARGKKIAIRWHRPRSWLVPVRLAHGLETAGV